MRRDQRRAALAPDKAEKLAQHPVGSRFIEIAGGLVRQHQIGLVGEPASDRHALLFAARQLAGAVIKPVAEPQRDEQFFRPRLGFGARPVRYQLRQDHVFQRIEIGQQVMELVDEAQVFAAQHGTGMRIRLLGRVAGYQDLPAEPAFEQPDRLQQCRLSRSRRPEQRDDLTRTDRQIDPAQHVDPLAALFEAAGEPLELDHRFHAGTIHNAAPARDRCSPPSTRGRAWRGN
jgi:hypothetical protein